ncbi:MAG: glycosyltransferase family 2 protein [Coriobacteriales bacterium]|nr:glycosyltransferase family 2 protein [Coriobacteriales bacterium]
MSRRGPVAELHSIVVPMYNEESVVDVFVRRAVEAFAPLPDWELIVVDDGSSDRTYELLRAHAGSDPRIKIVKFARNFGHQIAITAGIDLAGGDTVTVIDADLQDPPELIPALVDEWRNGADIVFAVRDSRAGESWLKKATASWFYRVLRALGDVDAPLDAGDFRLMSRRATEALRGMREQNRYMRGMVGWVGLNRAYVTYARDARYAGTTKYPLAKMVRLAANGLVSFSTRPLQIATFLGVAAAALGLCVGLWAIGERLLGNPNLVPGWASLMVAVLFVGGMQLFTLGIIGEYIGRIYDEVRQRPLYLIEEVTGFSGRIAEHFARSPMPDEQEG